MRLIYFKLNYEYRRTVNVGREKRGKKKKEKCNLFSSCSKYTYRISVALFCDSSISLTDLSLERFVYGGKECLNIESKICFIFDCSSFIPSSYINF